MPRFLYTGQPAQVEFPQGVSTRVGSLHLRPGKLTEVTVDELKFIRETRAVELTRLRQLPEVPAPEVVQRPSRAADKGRPAKKPTAAADDGQKEKSDGSGGGGKKKAGYSGS